MEEGKMKKLVMFTLAIVFALGVPMMAFGQGFFPVTPLVDDVDHNAVAVDQAVAVAADVDVDINKDFNSHNDTHVNANKEVHVNANKENLNNFQPRNSHNFNNDNSVNTYVVDNNILANVNIAAADKKGHDGGGRPDAQLAAFPFPQPEEECCPEVSQTNTLTQFKTQSASIAGFNCATGVSNANAAGGNLNAQTAYTTVGVAFVK
jgi:hypothetical protein